MKKVTKRFIRFWSPGSFVAEHWNRNVDSFDLSSIEWPDNAYSLTLHERDDVEDDGEVFKGKERQIGPRYYHPDSKIETLEAVKHNPNSSRTLISNMQGNGWYEIVWSRWGNWPQPFDRSEDEILTL